MPHIGGENPVFIPGFARECVARDNIQLEISPHTVASLQQLLDHRATVVDLACKEDASAYYSGDHRARQNVEVKFGDFLDYFSAAFRGEQHWLNSVKGLQFYLCQCPIAVYKPDETCAGAVLPCVMDLFRVPVALEAETVRQVNLWMAVKPSRTGIHYDAYRNVLIVLHGKKTVKLYPPSQTKSLYPRPIYTNSSNHSLVNFVEPDFSAHPEFARAKPTVISVSAGSGVYIPEGWWHQVDSDPFTIAVNFWFDGFRERLVKNPDMSAYYARVLLEDMVRAETKLAISDMNSSSRKNRAASDGISASAISEASILQEDREIALLSADEDDLKRLQVDLAAEFPGVWKSLLVQASDPFAAFLTDYWDRLADDTEWISAVFDVLEEDMDQVKQDLLVKQERFKQKICHQVLAKTFGIVM